MGMFDYVRVRPSFPWQPKCSCGKSLTGLQTKDFDCLLNVYEIAAGAVYWRGMDEDDPPRQRFSVGTQTVHVYTGCACGKWNEWQLIFVFDQLACVVRGSDRLIKTADHEKRLEWIHPNAEAFREWLWVKEEE